MYLLFDIGGTKMRIGVSMDGLKLGKTKELDSINDFDQAMQALQSEANAFLAGQKPKAVCIGLPGPIDRAAGKIIKLPNLGGWNEKPIRQRLQEIFDCPVHLENDAALAGLGEAVFGSGQGQNIVAYLTVSTGIGGARIVGGQIDANSLGFEPGHQIVVLDGQAVELESCVSGTAIKKIYGQEPQNIKDESLWEEVAGILAIGLNNTLVYWSPDVLVLGGSVMKSLPLEKVKTQLKQRVTIFRRLPEIRLATLGDQAGLYGALAYAKSKK